MKHLNLSKVEEQSFKYELLKISINSFLESYKEMLVDLEKDLVYYRKEKIQPLVELKKEHLDQVQGKIEILTNLKDK